MTPVQTRLIKINDQYFHWPVGAHRPASYAFSHRSLDNFASKHGAFRVANEQETTAAVAANTAGPNGKKLSAEDLVRCYQDDIVFERVHATEGVVLPGFWRN